MGFFISSEPQSNRSFFLEAHQKKRAQFARSFIKESRGIPRKERKNPFSTGNSADQYFPRRNIPSRAHVNETENFIFWALNLIRVLLYLGVLIVGPERRTIKFPDKRSEKFH
ncbi:hypothetical protein CEXT_40721 [Caerostris extrusa]|uniref:Uncharacterized protein n=1 Tax=Caerostris extrusa TaxID=172846 RepID=A0AAV4VXT1_CAEEX|nr:hypothetical protein CEXT_40721 [Caerostris extrusa]